MNSFVAVFGLVIVIGLFFRFVGYAHFLLLETWRDSFKGAAAISLVLGGFIAALAEWG